MKIYCQGRIVEEAEATISANDHGFLYGATLFETFRTYGGEPFLLKKHLERLAAGCRAYGIVPHAKLLVAHPPAYTALRETLRDLLSAHGLGDAVFRYTLSAGEAPGGLPDAPYQNAREMIFVRPLPPILAEACARLHILNTKRAEPEAWPRPKSGHYMNSIAGHRELRQRASSPEDEGLMLTRDGRLAEGVVSNLFLVTHGRLATPSPSAGILAGITRDAVIALAGDQGIETAETELRLRDLTGAEAIFTTNSVRGITPIAAVLDQNGALCWQQDSAGNGVVNLLRAAYSELPSHHNQRRSTPALTQNDHRSSSGRPEARPTSPPATQ